MTTIQDIIDLLKEKQIEYTTFGYSYNKFSDHISPYIYNVMNNGKIIFSSFRLDYLKEKILKSTRKGE